GQSCRTCGSRPAWQTAHRASEPKPTHRDRRASAKRRPRMRATMSRGTASAKRRRLRKKATSRSTRSTAIAPRLQRFRAKDKSRGKVIRGSGADSEVRAVGRVADSARRVAPVEAALVDRADPINAADPVDKISAVGSDKADTINVALAVKAARVPVVVVAADATVAVGTVAVAAVHAAAHSTASRRINPEKCRSAAARPASPRNARGR